MRRRKAKLIKDSEGGSRCSIHKRRYYKTFRAPTNNCPVCFAIWESGIER